MSDHERVSIPRKILAWMSGVIPIGKKRAKALREMHEKHAVSAEKDEAARKRIEANQSRGGGDIKSGPG
jgi:hypothetical protein